jgi:hypothetical protein
VIQEITIDFYLVDCAVGTPRNMPKKELFHSHSNFRHRSHPFVRCWLLCPLCSLSKMLCDRLFDPGAAEVGHGVSCAAARENAPLENPVRTGLTAPGQAGLLFSVVSACFSRALSDNFIFSAVTCRSAAAAAFSSSVIFTIVILSATNLTKKNG